MKELSLAPYVRGTFGPSQVGREPYVHSQGNGVVIEGGTSKIYGGEIGFVFRVADPLNLRVGAEALRPNPVTSQQGTRTSDGAAMYFLTSQIFVFNPNVALEFVVANFSDSRILFSAGVGYATVNLQNNYKFTSTGSTALSITDFTEDGLQNLISYFSTLALETHFIDRSMVVFEVGYRLMQVHNLVHGKNQKTLAETNGDGGQPLLNMDKSQRMFDLSGAFAGLSIRLYL